MHAHAPKQVGAARLKLDDALAELRIALRRIDTTSDSDELSKRIEQAIKYVEAALEETSG